MNGFGVVRVRKMGGASGYNRISVSIEVHDNDGGHQGGASPIQQWIRWGRHQGGASAPTTHHPPLPPLQKSCLSFVVIDDHHAGAIGFFCLFDVDVFVSLFGQDLLDEVVEGIAGKTGSNTDQGPGKQGGVVEIVFRNASRNDQKTLDTYN